jgi:DNA-binding transcriptional regulator/RsmH inhibitor MraZ
MSKLQQNTFIVTKEQENYLTIYPINIWEKQVGSKVVDLPHSDDVANRLRRLIGLNTTDTKLDSQGRITVPPEY